MDDDKDEKSIIEKMVQRVNTAVENIVNTASAAAMQSMEQQPKKAEQPIASLLWQVTAWSPIRCWDCRLSPWHLPRGNGPPRKRQPQNLRRESHPPKKLPGNPRRNPRTKHRRNPRRENQTRLRNNAPAKSPQRNPPGKSRRNRPARQQPRKSRRKSPRNRSADCVNFLNDCSSLWRKTPLNCLPGRLPRGSRRPS